THAQGWWAEAAPGPATGRLRRYSTGRWHQAAGVGLSQAIIAGKLRQPADDAATWFRAAGPAAAPEPAGAQAASPVRAPAQRPAMVSRPAAGFRAGHAGLAGFSRLAPAWPVRRAWPVYGAASEPSRPGLPVAGRPVDVHRCAPGQRAPGHRRDHRQPAAVRRGVVGGG